MRREPNDPALRQRMQDRLPDPPHRVRGQPEAAAAVELLDRADQADVALLDEIEQRRAALRIPACDRDDESEIRLDQTPSRRLVAQTLASDKLALLDRRKQRAATELTYVDRQRILGSCPLSGVRLGRPAGRTALAGAGDC
jgi:hypothetical protein